MLEAGIVIGWLSVSLRVCPHNICIIFCTCSIQAWTHQLHFQFEKTSSEYLRVGSVSRSWVQGQGNSSEFRMFSIQALGFEFPELEFHFQCEGTSLKCRRLPEFQGQGIYLKDTAAKQWQRADLYSPWTQFNFICVCLGLKLA